MGGLHFEVSQPVEFQVSRFQIRHDRSKLDGGGCLVIAPCRRGPCTQSQLVGFQVSAFQTRFGRKAATRNCVRILTPPTHPEDVPETLASIRADGAELGWQPRIPFPNGPVS
jgi:hypothetical protein